MVTTFKGLANKWVVLALLLASLGAVLAITLLPLGAQSGAIEFPENSEEAVADFTAVDPEGTSTITTWGIVAVADVGTIDGVEAADAQDAEHFKIEDGILSFTSAPNYEAPSGGGAELNTYSLVISAKVGSETSYEKVQVKVTNVDEPATTGIALSLIQPREGSRIRVLFTDSVGNPFVGADGLSLSPALNADYPTGDTDSGIVDPDGDKDATNAVLVADDMAIPADNVAYQWSRGSSRTGTFTDIEDAEGPIYTVVDDDRTRFLRVTATYEDEEGEGKVLMATSTYPTLRLRTDTTSPEFPDNEPASPTTTELLDAEIADGAGEGTIVGVYTASRETAHNERLTYSLEGATTATQADFFQINRETGQVTVAKGKTIQDEADVHADDEGEEEPSGGFIVTIRAVDGYEDIQENPITRNTGTGELTITVDGVDEDPVFSAGKMSHEFAENTAISEEVYDFDAYDPETASGEATFALSGPDAGDFALATDGTLTFVAIPNFESPADANKDNIYEITVKASAASTIDTELKPEKSTSINVTVTVTNVDESGEVALSARNPRIGVPISARVVSDTDGAVTGVTWRWERDETGAPGSATDPCSGVADDAWEEAKGDGANSATYTPQLADDGKCLRAVASYADPAGTGGTANEVSDVAVVKARNLAPMFDNAMETRYVEENSAVEVPAVANDDGTTEVAADDPVTASDENDAEPATTDGPIVYTLSGADAMYFTIDNADTTLTGTGTVAAGQIRVSSAGAGKLDFETRRTYTVRVTATDRSGLNSSITVTINIVDEDEGPEIMRGRLAVSGPPLVPYTSMGTGDVATYTAVGRDADGATWSLSGDDAGDFGIDADGVLTFNNPPNSASPADANMDNHYDITVVATSGTLMAEKPVTVTVGMAVAAEARTDISQYTNQERFDLDGNGIVDASEIQQAIIIWIQDNPEN